MIKFIFGLIFLLNSSMIYANAQSVVWYTYGADKQVNINVELFMSSTCPHCINADAFFQQIEKKMPWVVVHRYVINQDKLALRAFYDRLQEQHLTGFSVPAIFFCGSRWSGFSDANTTGKVLLDALTYCHKRIKQQGELTQATTNVLQRGGNASKFQYGSSITSSVPLLIVSTALMDAMSPCSFFCFAAFLAFLWLFPTQKWLQFSVGMVFILSLGSIHYVQQAHSNLYYQIIPKLRLADIAVAILLFFVMFGMYRKMTSRVLLKPGPLFFSGVIFTVIAMQIAQQTCTFNVAMVFEQWWTEHTITLATHRLYLIVYQFFYVLPLVFMLLFFLIFGQYQRICSFQQKLTPAAYLVLMSIGVILLVYPYLLANLLISIVVPLVSVIGGWLIARQVVE